MIYLWLKIVPVFLCPVFTMQSLDTEVDKGKKGLKTFEEYVHFVKDSGAEQSIQVFAKFVLVSLVQGNILGLMQWILALSANIKLHESLTAADRYFSEGALTALAVQKAYSQSHNLSNWREREKPEACETGVVTGPGKY